jgi:hypothetical protein
VTLAPTLGVPSNEQSRRLYHSFLYEVVPSLCESLDSAFWQTEILRNSASRPAVQHAAIALGALYEQHLARQNDTSQSASKTHDAKLELMSSLWYTAAIKSLRNRIIQSSSNTELVEEAMMACLLFVYIELLRGDDIAAVTHLEGAISIYRNGSPHNTAPISQESQCNPAMTSALQAVSKIFVRLDIQAVSYMGSRAPWFPIQSLSEFNSLENIPQSFNTLLEARDSLYFHLISILTFITPPHGAEQCFPGWTPHPDRGFDTYTIFHGSTYRDYSLPQAGSQRRRFMKILSNWKSAFQGFLQKGTARKPEELAECALLWLSFHTTRIKLAVSYSENECLYDDQLPQFKKIVEQAEVYRRYTVGVSPSQWHASSEEDYLAEKMRKIRPKKRDLSIQMGVNYPLYFAALKCRHRPLRQQALALLQGTCIESVWDGQMLARIAEYVINVEEATTCSSGLPQEWDSFGVPEVNRIHCLSLNIDKGSKRIWLQYNRRVVTLLGEPSRNVDVNKRWRIDNTILSW